MAREGKFRDEAVLRVEAGRGGDGCCSFRREKYVSFGGPNGGDGGHGGNVVLRAVAHENSLFRLSRTRTIRADSGRPGGTNNKTGASGEHTVVEVPTGTQVRDLERGNLMADLESEGDEVVVALGGKGGRGNARFVSSTNQAPRRYDKGTEGESRDLALELKLVADIGLVGLPNAGKSTLLRRVTQARPKVADYPFTTLDPNLGIWETGQQERPTLVLADIPGLIEGASDGKGLGLQFLRHVERTRVLLHMVDCSDSDGEPSESFRVIRDELASHSDALASRRTLLIATKVEDEASALRAESLFAAAGTQGICISSVTGEGLGSLLQAFLGEVNSTSDRRN